MAASDFLLDTNVLLSATTPARSRHEHALRALNDWPNDGIGICTSGQVLREYLVVATRGLELNGLGLSIADALANRDRLEARMRFLEETHVVAVRLRHLVQSSACTGKQIHDANVVATALAHGVERILTENVDDFAQFADLVEIVALRAV
jgi:predicted nucleic acid-binding protein